MLSADGLHPDPEKVEAVVDMSSQEDKPAPQRFPGMTSWLSNFMQNFSTITSPLRDLLHDDHAFCMAAAT